MLILLYMYIFTWSPPKLFIQSYFLSIRMCLVLTKIIVFFSFLLSISHLNPSLRTPLPLISKYLQPSFSLSILMSFNLPVLVLDNLVSFWVLVLTFWLPWWAVLVITTHDPHNYIFSTSQRLWNRPILICFLYSYFSVLWSISGPEACRWIFLSNAAHPLWSLPMYHLHKTIRGKII